MPTEQDILTELRISVAELRGEVRHINVKLDEAVVSRDHLEKKLAPIIESMNRGKGALAAATLMAGAIGATVATVVKEIFNHSPLP
jgi:hypothetical protein